MLRSSKRKATRLSKTKSVDGESGRGNALRESRRVYRSANLVDYAGLRWETEGKMPVGQPYCPHCEGLGLLVKLVDGKEKGGLCCICCDSVYRKPAALQETSCSNTRNGFSRSARSWP
jgi:hypothetical protein